MCNLFLDENIQDTGYIPQFLGNSYTLYKSLPQPIASKTVISMAIKPFTANGLLFYAGNLATTKSNSDFFAIYLKSGYIVVSLDLGGGLTVLR